MSQRPATFLAPVPPRVLAQLSLGLALVACALSAWVWRVKAPVSGDRWMAEQIQSFPTLNMNATWVNGAGDWVRIIAVVVGAWIAIRPALKSLAPMPGRREALVGLATALLLSFVNAALTSIVDSPRPDGASGLRIESAFDGNGFPSGSVFADVLLCGALAFYAPAYVPRWAVIPVRTLLIGLLLLAGPARISVGAHWPIDVYGGMLWGAAGLFLAFAVARWAATRP